jgi:hypothetical protein
VLACGAAWLCLAGPALAQEDVPQDNGSVDQYAESLPSASGDRALTQGGPGRTGAALPRNIQRRLPSTPTGRLLGRVSTQTALGAPDRREVRRRRFGSPRKPSAASAIGGALFGSSALPALVLMAVVALAALAAAVARRRASD